MRFLFCVMSVALGQNQLLANLTEIIQDFTEGSGFSFAETFPDVTVEAENVTSEIIDGINSQFSKHENFKSKISSVHYRVTRL